MSTSNIFGPAIAAVLLIGTTAFAGGAAAAPMSTAATTIDKSPGGAGVQPVRHRRWGGVGIYIGPGYGYYPSYGYYDDYDYYPRRYYPRRSYYYDRPYRTHSRRWVQERFKHPLGRR
jgi:hypothetical protein